MDELITRRRTVIIGNKFRMYDIGEQIKKRRQKFDQLNKISNFRLTLANSFASPPALIMPTPSEQA